MKQWFGLTALMLLVPWGAQAACTISSSALAFGTFTGPALNGTGSATVTCTTGTAYSVGASTGQHWTGGTYGRSMSGSAGGALGYQLFRDGTRSSQLGSTPGTDTIAGTGSGAAQAVTIYGSVNPWAYNAPGTFTDTVTMSVFSSFPTVTASMAVSTIEPKSCTISTTPLAFGIYSGAVVNATTTLTVTCTNTTPYQIGADNGQNPQFIGVYAKYIIGPSSNKLRYHLYTDAARSIEWGTTAGTNEVAGTGTGGAQTTTVYGTVGAGSYGSAPGSYSDIVTFTITY